ncbi:hypothetical protein DFR31_0031 [Alkalispirillum mobile]|uniref:Uncharacterized protein n=1 Tax=Alkalispirillum mobile TaxID=85925 RepID=A0A498C3R3_9GAMM|nr:hypothetical protein [Alkalispirillum mobile]RLK50142.1 hypothetical protein DFR31_0031 [Alkalispirillum mobile]
MSDQLPPDASLYDVAAANVVDRGNELLEQHEDGDAWEVASGMLAGAIHYWLYSRQPCGDPGCADCADLSSAEERLRALLEEVQESARTSDYYHSPHDHNVGNA